jgi:hypothetical protein
MNFISALVVNKVIAGAKVTIVSERLANGKSNKPSPKYCYN